MSSSDLQKQRAIESHGARAQNFANSYQQLNRDPYQDCFTYSRHRLEALLEDYLPQQGNGYSLLDLGCGTGHYTAHLRRKGFAVAGVDGSAEMLELARMNNPGVPMRQADVEQIPFEANSFDFVICIEVLRYLPDIDGCIRELTRVLKPGGTALVTAHPAFNLNGYWFVNRIANQLPVGNLVRLKQFFATSGQLRRSFQQAGCDQVDVNGVYLGPINWVSRLAKPVLPGVLKSWEPLDRKLANQPVIREFANMFLIHAVKAN